MFPGLESLEIVNPYFAPLTQPCSKPFATSPALPPKHKSHDVCHNLKNSATQKASANTQTEPPKDHLKHLQNIEKQSSHQKVFILACVSWKTSKITLPCITSKLIALVVWAPQLAISFCLCQVTKSVKEEGLSFHQAALKSQGWQVKWRNARLLNRSFSSQT